MNTGYYKDLDENFNAALELLERNYLHSDLINMLKYGNIPQKQFAALNLEKVTSFEDALILAENLVGQDGKVREAVSMKINELISDFFLNEKIFDKFLSGIIDVNGNVCRNIISAVCKLKQNNVFCQYFTKKLIKLTNEIIPKIDDFDDRDGKYKVNKELFKLYWCLETLYEFTDYVKINELKQILLKTKDCDEYTIREKTAKILTKTFNDPQLLAAKAQLKNDTNYYVKRI